MNKQLLTLILGLILSVAPVCLAEEAVTVAQDQVTEVSQPEAAPVVTETTMPSSDVVAPEQTTPSAEPELTEEEFKAFLDQLIAEAQKGEEANKKKAQQNDTQATDAAAVIE